jgi:hypothetical protein
MHRPLAYRFGPRVVLRQDAGQSRIWRIFIDSLEVGFSSDRAMATRIAQRAARSFEPDGHLDAMSQGRIA